MLTPVRVTETIKQDTPDQDVLEEIRLRDELLSVMSHDLRSPLGAVAIFCELLLNGDGATLHETHQRHVELICEACAKAQRILDDAGELSRIYKGSVTLSAVRVEVGPIVRECVELLKGAASKLGVELEEQLPAEELYVHADADRLRQIVLRIAEEAVMACGREGKAVLAVRLSDDDASVAIEAFNQGGQQRPRRESKTSLKGRLASSRPDESRYSIEVARRVAQLMGGELVVDDAIRFRAILTFRRLAQA